MEHIFKLRLAVLVFCLLRVERSHQIAIMQHVSTKSIEQRVTSMEGEIDHLQTQNEKMVECVTNIPTDTAQCRRENFVAGTSSCGRNVMFSAQVTKQADDFAAEHTIVFDSAGINVGGCYSSHTGIFTCCSTGYYIFFWSTTTTDRTETELVKNTSPVVVNSVSEAETDSTGTMMVLLHLHLDDKVRIRMKPKHSPTVKLAPKWATFTGYKL